MGNQAQATTSGFGGQQNAAISAIQSSLFSPRQPPPGIGGTPGNQVGGTAIAGVATTYKGEGIKRVNERSKYQEWEFVYDLKQDKTVVGNLAGQQNLKQQNQTTGRGTNPP